MGHLANQWASPFKTIYQKDLGGLNVSVSGVIELSQSIHSICNDFHSIDVNNVDTNYRISLWPPDDFRTEVLHITFKHKHTHMWPHCITSNGLYWYQYQYMWLHVTDSTFVSVTETESDTEIYRLSPHPISAVIIVSMTMRHAQRISCGPDKQWSFTKTRRSLQQLVKSMPSVSKLIKTSPLSSDTPSIAAGAQCVVGGGGGVHRHSHAHTHAHTHTHLRKHAQHSDDWSEIPISQGAEVD